MNSQPIDTKRHSYAHLLAAAIEKLFPGTKFGVGPVIEHGFYYDVLSPTPLRDEDLVKLTSTVKKLIKENLAFHRNEMSLDDAIKFFKDKGQDFKVELLEDLKKHGTTNMKAEERAALGEAPKTVSLYTTGEFVDLCRGPHIETTKQLSPDSFKLTSIAGAYWRGSEKNPQLQRIYGVAFETKEELDTYFTLLEEAKKRDHRKLGKELGLFTILDEVGPGLPLFYPKGALLRRLVEDFITGLQESRGYTPIWIPHITKGELYRISGHLEKYDAMYPPMDLKDEAQYYLKPMNCPHFMMLYKSTPHSYRGLPVRWTCTTTNYRYEKSGELSGLTRVRALTQDDCHVFVTPDHLKGEIRTMLEMIQTVYQTFGFNDFWVRISTHDPREKGKYIGDPKIWERSEALLTELIEATGWKHEIGVGEAAFYGPKLDFMLRDVLGREWQLTTIQLDMNLPERFELEYIDAEGEKKRPIVIHRAILGSTERFLGILIEHYGGAFPVWLAPTQVVVATISEKHQEYGKKVYETLRNAGIRAELRDDSETIGKKIRETETQKVPYMLIVGDKEVEARKVAVRKRSEGDKGQVSADEFINQLLEEVKHKK